MIKTGRNDEQNLRVESPIVWESSSYAVVMSSSEVNEKLKGK